MSLEKKLAGKTIGILGGTFNPVHYGHLRPALEVKELLSLDEVRLIPSFIPVHRAEPQISVAQRCEMLQLAIQEIKGFSVDFCEVGRGGASYTVETLEILQAQNPDATLVFIMGRDAFRHFLSWHRWQDILRLANLVVTKRPQEEEDFAPELQDLRSKILVESFSKKIGQLVELEVTQLDISSTKMREFVQVGVDLSFLTPSAVVDFISQNNLYKES